MDKDTKNLPKKPQISQSDIESNTSEVWDTEKKETPKNKMYLTGSAVLLSLGVLLKFTLFSNSDNHKFSNNNKQIKSTTEILTKLKIPKTRIHNDLHFKKKLKTIVKQQQNKIIKKKAEPQREPAQANVFTNRENIENTHDDRYDHNQEMIEYQNNYEEEYRPAPYSTGGFFQSYSSEEEY